MTNPLRRKRFGETAIEKGFLSEEQLGEALREQKNPASESSDRPIGEILLDKGFLSADQVIEVLDAIVGD